MGEVVGLEKPMGGSGSAKMELVVDKLTSMNNGSYELLASGEIYKGSWLLVLHEITMHTQVGIYRVVNGVVGCDEEPNYYKVTVESGALKVQQSGSTTALNTYIFLYQVKGG